MPPHAPLQLPHHTLLLEDEIAGLLTRHGGAAAAGGSCDCEHGPGGAPRFCHLGLPLAAGADGSSSNRGGGSGGEGSGGGLLGVGSAADGSHSGAAADASRTAAAGAEAGSSSGTQQEQQQQRRHRLAVLIPYRDRPAHLATLLAALHPHLDRQHREHDVFVVEQADRLLFNRGALLNAAALLLQGSSYDYFCFQVGRTVGQLFLLGGCMGADCKCCLRGRWPLSLPITSKMHRCFCLCACLLCCTAGCGHRTARGRKHLLQLPLRCLLDSCLHCLLRPGAACCDLVLPAACLPAGRLACLLAGSDPQTVSRKLHNVLRVCSIDSPRSDSSEHVPWSSPLPQRGLGRQPPPRSALRRRRSLIEGHLILPTTIVHMGGRQRNAAGGTRENSTRPGCSTSPHARRECHISIHC